MSHYNMHIGYPTSNSRGGQPDAPATTRALPQPLPLPPPPPIRAPPPPTSRPVIPPMPRQDPLMPPMTRQEYQRAQYAPNPTAGPYTYAPVQRGPQTAAPVQHARPANPPAPSYLTCAPVPPRNAVPLTQNGLVAYDCPHQDCVRRIWVTSVTEHMWNAHGVRM